MKTTILHTISDYDLQLILDRNCTYSGILRELNLSESSGYYRKILSSRMAGLDCTKFEDIRRGCNIFNNNWKKHENEDLFVENSVADPTTIRQRFKKIYPQKNCCVCKIDTMHNNKPLEFHLDHINGNKKDNRLENLRWICPNCHSQTSTYTGKNKKR